MENHEFDRLVLEALRELNRPVDCATIAGHILGNRFYAGQLANYKVDELLESIWRTTRRLNDAGRIDIRFFTPPLDLKGKDKQFVTRERAEYSLPVLDRLAEI